MNRIEWDADFRYRLRADQLSDDQYICVSCASSAFHTSPTTDQLLPSGFNHNHPSPEETLPIQLWKNSCNACLSVIYSEASQKWIKRWFAILHRLNCIALHRIAAIVRKSKSNCTRSRRIGTMCSLMHFTFGIQLANLCSVCTLNATHSSEKWLFVSVQFGTVTWFSFASLQ